MSTKVENKMLWNVLLIYELTDLVFYLPYFYFCFCNFHSSITQAVKRSMWKILMAFVGPDSCNMARSQWGYLTPLIGPISEVVPLSMPY